MFDDDYDGPPLHIPQEALRKPKGAEVGDDGKVSCVSCKERFALSAVDIVGQGYRCVPCSHQAHVASLDRGGANVDAGAHLSRGAREELRTTGGNMQKGGVLLLLLGIIVFAITLASDIDTKLGIIIAAAGVGLFGTGSMKKNAAG
jgi:hypothetical protein